MSSLEYTFWRDGKFFLGYLNQHPNYWSQAYSLDELVENLRSLLIDLRELGLA